jgi:hypothetical protein
MLALAGLLSGVGISLILATITSDILIDPASARQILGDIAKISGTMLALFTTFILFVMKDRPHLLKSVIPLGLFTATYSMFAFMMILCFVEILRIGDTQVSFFVFRLFWSCLPLLWS